MIRRPRERMRTIHRTLAHARSAIAGGSHRVDRTRLPRWALMPEMAARAGKRKCWRGRLNTRE